MKEEKKNQDFMWGAITGAGAMATVVGLGFLGHAIWNKKRDMRDMFAVEQFKNFEDPIYLIAPLMVYIKVFIGFDTHVDRSMYREMYGTVFRDPTTQRYRFPPIGMENPVPVLRFYFENGVGLLSRVSVSRNNFRLNFDLGTLDVFAKVHNLIVDVPVVHIVVANFIDNDVEVRDENLEEGYARRYLWGLLLQTAVQFGENPVDILTEGVRFLDLVQERDPFIRSKEGFRQMLLILEEQLILANNQLLEF